MSLDLHTGRPFWPWRDGLIETYPPLRQDLVADVAVIGGGISGALAAYELTSAGASVVVLEKDHVADGSSAASSGLLLYDTDTSLEELTANIGEANAVRVYRLGAAAIDRIAMLTREMDHACGFAYRDSFYLASNRRAVPELEREYQTRKRHDFDVEWLDARQVAARGSFRAPAAIYARGTAEIDSYRFTHQLLAVARNRGARVHERTRVTRVRPRHGGVELDISGDYSVRARRVIGATGYEAGVRLRTNTATLASTWIWVSEPVEAFVGWPDRCLIWETARPYLYMRTTEDGRILCGGEDEAWAERHRSTRLLERKTRRLVSRVERMFPKIEIDVASQWGGTFATTPDGLPLIGEVADYPGVSFALGYGGNGITFSVIAAQIVRDAYLGVPNPDAALFAIDRHAPVKLS